MNIDISIIIVNYNSHNLIYDCISSIQKHTKGINYEIIIVDNNSSDKEILSIKNKFSDVELILLDINYGFGAGCNFGAKSAKGEYLLFLNPDTIINNNCFKELFDFMDNSINAAVCSPSFINQDGKQGYVFNYFPDFVWELFDFFGSGYEIRINKLNKILKTYSVLKKPIRVDWNTGACLLVSKQYFNAVKGFDEEYFLYYEDVDLQKRITSQGGVIFCLPYLKVIHITNAITKKGNDDSVYYYNMYKSKLIYYKKNCSSYKMLFVKYLHVLGISLRLLILNSRKRYSDRKEIKRLQYKEILKYYLKNRG